MMRITRAVVLSMLTVGWLPAGGPARAAPTPVQDKAGIFSNPAEIEQASADIQEIKRQFGKYLVIETLKKPPSAYLVWPNANKVKAMDPAAREQYFADLAKRRVHPSTILILICQDPLEVQVAVGRGTDLQKAFPKTETDKVRQILLAHLPDKDPGQGLLEAVAHVRKTLEDFQANAANEPSFPWPAMLETILVILGVWLAIEAARAVQGRGREPEAVIDGNSHGVGGSILPGLFATMGGLQTRPAFSPQVVASSDTFGLPVETIPSLPETDGPEQAKEMGEGESTVPRTDETFATGTADTNHPGEELLDQKHGEP